MEKLVNQINDGSMRLHHIKDLNEKTVVLISGLVLKECYKEPREDLQQFMNCEVETNFDYLIVLDLIK